MFKIEGVYYLPFVKPFTNGFVQDLIASNSNTIGFNFEIGSMNSSNGLINPSAITWNNQLYKPSEVYALRGFDSVNSIINSNGINLFAKLMIQLNYSTGVLGGTNGTYPNPTDKSAWFDSFSSAILQSCEFLSTKNVKYIQLIDDWDANIFANDTALCTKLASLIDQIHSKYSFLITSNLWTPTNQINQISGLTASSISKFDILGIGFFPYFTKIDDPSLAQLIVCFFD